MLDNLISDIEALAHEYAKAEVELKAAQEYRNVELAKLKQKLSDLRAFAGIPAPMALGEGFSFRAHFPEPTGGSVWMGAVPSMMGGGRGE